MITVYGQDSSGNCYKPRLLLAKLGIPFRHVETKAGPTGTRTAAFIARNPNGKVPLMELEDGRLLAESDAMLLYLAEGTRFMPADRYERGLAYQWLFFEQYSHEPYVAVRRALLIYPDRAKDATPERLASTLVGGEKALRVMDERAAADAVLCRQCDECRRHRALRLYARCGDGWLRPRGLSGGQRLARPRRSRSRPRAADLAAELASARRLAGLAPSWVDHSTSSWLTMRAVGPPCHRNSASRAAHVPKNQKAGNNPAFRLHDRRSTLCARPPVHP